MHNKGSDRMRWVDEAIIPLISQAIKDKPGTISLGQGVVNYPPPPQALESAHQRMAEPSNSQHLYGSVQGIDELQQAIVEKIQRHNNIDLGSPQAIFVTAGANMAFHALILAICDIGDEVILLTPYYFNHEMTITMCGNQAKCVATDQDYQPVIADIEKNITEKTKAVVTVSPNNPSGAVYSQKVLSEINALCARYNIYHISDEAYEHFVFAQHHHFSPASLATAEPHTATMFSMSKSYGFASWRIGYMIVPEHLRNALIKVQDNILICPPVVSQYAALACLQNGDAYLQQCLQVLDENRKLCLAALSSLIEKGIISAPPALGAMYLFVRLNSTVNDKELSQRLIDEYQVAVIPGSAFGDLSGPALRISYGALDRETLQEGMRRLSAGLHDILL